MARHWVVQMATQTVDLRVATIHLVGKKVVCWVVQMATQMAGTTVDQTALTKAERMATQMACHSVDQTATRIQIPFQRNLPREGKSKGIPSGKGIPGNFGEY